MRNTHSLGDGERGTNQDIEEGSQVRGTHKLETTEGETSQNMGRKQLSKGSLTNWRPQREGQLRSWKESNWARGTYKLETAEGGTSQDIKGN